MNDHSSLLGLYDFNAGDYGSYIKQQIGAFADDDRLEFREDSQLNVFAVLDIDSVFHLELSDL